MWCLISHWVNAQRVDIYAMLGFIHCNGGYRFWSYCNLMY